jgi:LysM repeat protein
MPTDAPPTVTPFPTSTLDTTVFPYMVPYTVVQGDTVGALATRYGSTVEAIIIANGLGSDARIFVTQQLQIPVSTLPTETPIPSATPIPSETPLPTFTPFPTFTISPTPEPISTEVPVQVVPVDPGAPEDLPIVIAQTYTVQYGDSLSGIAKRFGVDTRELARINNIVNPNLIHVGQVLQIPVSGAPTAVPSATPAPSATTIPPTPTLINPLIYQVQPGDNLYRISIKFNVPLETLIEINGIANASRIFVGQLLVIPQ